MTNLKTERKARSWGMIIVIIALIIVLIGVNLLYTPASTWHGVLTGEAGTVLYAAGFDGFTDEWQQYTGRESAQIADGVMRMSIDSSSVIFSAAQPYFADMDITVNARAVSGSDNNAFGVVFRLQQPNNACTMPLQILCDISNSNAFIGAGLKLLFGGNRQQSGYFMFLISSDGYYSVWRGTADGQDVKISDWIFRDDIINLGLNVDNQLRIVAQGNQYRFFINGTAVEVCRPNDPAAQSTYYNALQECVDGTMQETLTDDTFPTGQIALVVDSLHSEAGFVIEFDRLVVTSPSEESLVESDQT